MTTKIEQLRSLLKQYDELTEARDRVEGELCKLVVTYRSNAVSTARFKLRKYTEANEMLTKWNEEFNPAVDLSDEEDDEELEEN